MIHPSPTTPVAIDTARGTLEEVVAPTATKPGYIVVSFPNTSYQTHLIPTGPVTAQVGKRIVGVVRGSTRRVDSVQTGGRYVEPVFGRPRRVQGTVVATDARANTITVNAGFPLVCEIGDHRQRAEDFEVGEMVTFDMPEAARFEERGK
ncbi:MAG: hypothetical protein KIT19_12135 [Phycisphaeraceae bacterium]|nr:hypothetical protein [Phycisphaeraceae bacterium]